MEGDKVETSSVIWRKESWAVCYTLRAVRARWVYDYIAKGLRLCLQEDAH